MDRFSRALVEALSPSLMPDPRRPGWSERYLHQICEAGMSRLAADPRAEPMAARSLFASARSLMRVQDQLRTSRLIDAHLARARAFFEQERGGAADGAPRSTARASPAAASRCGGRPSACRTPAATRLPKSDPG